MYIFMFVVCGSCYSQSQLHMSRYYSTFSDFILPLFIIAIYLYIIKVTSFHIPFDRMNWVLIILDTSAATERL